MLLKLREDNSNFLAVFCRDSLTVMYCTYLSLQFYGLQLLENPNDIHVHLHVIMNEFIMTIHPAEQRLYMYILNGVHNSCGTNHRQLLFRRHVNDDSKYYIFTVLTTKNGHRKDQKFSRFRIAL